jgi:NADH dehydrogenase (ubiquinone) 1 alpha subcomplex subunit 9
MTNEKEIAFSLQSSNVAISCVGSHVFYTKEKDFEEANIRVPMAIANAVKNSPQIKRFVYVSAAGADPNSQSKRLRTKWIGEQEVKAIYPDVTILRPTYIVQNLNPNVTIAAKWGMHMKMFNRMLWQIEGMGNEVQPVFVNDVALAILNSLRMEETIGQSYDLGGPHTYTYEEIYEMFFDITQIKPYITTVKLEDAYYYAHMPWYQSYYRQLFRTWLKPEFMTIESQNLVVNPLNKSFEDLHIKPISFGAKAHELVNDVYWLYNAHTVTKRDTANQ